MKSIVTNFSKSLTNIKYPNKFEGWHIEGMLKKSNQSFKFDVREILVCSIVLDDIMSRMVDGGINTAEGMLDFLKQVLDEINKAFGNIIELDINYNHADVGGAPICNKFTIVDRKGPKKTDPEKINITGP